MRRRGRDGHPHARARTSWSAPRKRPSSTRPRSGRSSSSIPGIICYPTTGIGPTIEDRYRHVELLDDMGLIRAGFVDTGSVNLGGTGPDGLPPRASYVYTNTFADDRATRCTCAATRGLGPSIAVFEPGFLRVVLAYARQGALPAGTLVKFYFSGGGYLGGGEPLWGAPPIIEALDLYPRDARRRADPVGGRGARRLAARHADRARRAGARRPPPRRHRRLGRRPRRTSSRSRPRPSCAPRVGRPVATIAETEELLELPA